MIFRCDAEVAHGVICKQCGRKHRYLISTKTVLLAAGTLVAAALVWLFGGRGDSEYSGRYDW